MDKEKIGKILLIFGTLTIALFLIIESFKVSITFGIFVIGVICFELAMFLLN